MSRQVKEIVLTRKQKGQAIYENGGVKALGQDFYAVRSQTNPDREYCVDVISQSCTCEDYNHRLLICKHLYAVQTMRTERIKTALLHVRLRHWRIY